MKNYSKYLFSALIFLFTFPLMAAEWGISSDYETDDSRDSTYCMDKFLSGSSISYYIKYGSNRTLEEDFLYDNLTIEAFRLWPLFVKNQIIKAGRESEFADIMPLLTKSVSLKKLSSPVQGALTVRFVNENKLIEICGEGTGGCFSMSENSITVPLISQKEDDCYTREDVLASLTHEIGHFYGLADQYQEAIEFSSATHSTSDRVDTEDSLMAIGNSLGCDDADGFINLIDFTLAQNKGAYSTRAQKGWKSFCDDTMYQNAKVLNRTPFWSGRKKYEYDASGNIRSYSYYNPFRINGREIHEDQEIPTYSIDKQEQIWTHFVLHQDEAEGEYLSAFVMPFGFEIPIFQTEATRGIEAETNAPSWNVPYEQDEVFLSFPPENGICQITHFPTHEFSETLSFDKDGNLLKEFYYYRSYFNDEPLVDTALNKISAYLSVALVLEGNDQICGISFSENNNDSILLDHGEIVDIHQEGLNRISQKYQLSQQSILDSAKILCDKKHYQKSEKMSDFKDFCIFFTKVENNYQQHH